MTEPEDGDGLRLTFEVRASVERAFAVWTTRATLWWPKSHTITGEPADIIFEPYVGGRIVERGPDGSEHDWGRIVEWSAPHRLAFRWHHIFDPEQATDVTVTFSGQSASTLVCLEQRGFAALGDQAERRRLGNQAGWSAVTGSFTRVCAAAS